MKIHIKTALCLTIFIGILAASPSQAQDFYSKRSYVSASTGYVQSTIDGSSWRGSGCIVRDPRLVYSCAHVLFKNGLWATQYRFSPGYHSSSSPYTTSGIAPRGFRHFTSYASNYSTYGVRDSRTYHLDFTVMYNPTNFGTAVGWWSDGGAALRSNKWKRIVGYPANIAYTGASGYAYQHATDWFTYTGKTVFGSYHGFDRVSTGSGNSGGPVFVWDGSESYFAGVLVSGTNIYAGVRASDSESNTMATDSLGALTASRTFSNASSLLLPDAATSYSTRSVSVSGFNGNVQNLAFSTNITTTWRGDLEVYLRSPSGRIRWVSKKEGSSADNLVRTNADYSTNFRGYAANGRWDLKMRDSSSGDRATFRSFSINVTAP